MKAEDIAAVIERDLLSDNTKSKTAVTACWSCGYTFKSRPHGRINANFCSKRCQDYYDDGNPTYEQQQQRESDLEVAPLNSFKCIAGPSGTVGTNLWQSILGRCGDGTPMRRGTKGYHIQCKGCGKEFESKGLRCCSIDRERRYLEGEANRKLMAEVGIAPAAKRRCANPDCNNTIPKWRNGRKVPSNKRFC